ncbi:MAG: Gfo/Idh/MocA family protein [Acidobacteriota bacterium]
MSKLRFAIFGTGFWSRFQLAGWNELDAVECVAVYNRTRSKAEALASEFGIAGVYDCPEELLDRESLDFIDIITDADSHGRFVQMVAERRLPVICQKPMAPSFESGQQMVRTCRQAKVAFLIHENWRWQTPIRSLKKILQDGSIGRPFRARIQFCSSFPVFQNQPFLRELNQFILSDIGSHILDVARFLFGEAENLYCHTERINQGIKGEDVATVVLKMSGNPTVICEMSYATRMEHERFPETFIFVEGEKGSVELGPDYWIRLTTGSGTHARRCPPPRYGWADPAYNLVHASIVPCSANLLGALQGKARAETSGEDNLETMRLVFACYESARSGQSVRINGEDFEVGFVNVRTQ